MLTRACGGGGAQEEAPTGKAEIVVESAGFGHKDWGRQTVLRLSDCATTGQESRAAESSSCSLDNGETD